MSTPLPTEPKKQELPLLNDFFISLQTNNYSSETIYNYKKDLLMLEYFFNHASVPF